jgi:hypothetical protein
MKTAGSIASLIGVVLFLTGIMLARTSDWPYANNLKHWGGFILCVWAIVCLLCRLTHKTEC